MLVCVVRVREPDRTTEPFHERSEGNATAVRALLRAQGWGCGGVGRGEEQAEGRYGGVAVVGTSQRRRRINNPGL